MATTTTRPDIPPPPGFVPVGAGVAADVPPPPGFVPLSRPSAAHDLSDPTVRRTGAQVRPTTPATPPAIGELIGGLATSQGANPSDWPALVDAINPVTQGREAIAAARRGDWSGGLNRTIQAGMNTVLPGGGLAVPMVEGLLSAPYEQFAKANEATNPAQRAGYLLSSVLPVVGKPLADIGDRLVTPPATPVSDQPRGPNEPQPEVPGPLAHLDPRAAGEAIGTVGGALIGSRGKADYAEFDPNTIRRTHYERTGNLRALSDVLEHSMSGSSAFDKLRFGAIDDIARLTNDLTQRISKFNGTTEQLGKRLAQGATQVRAAISRQVRKLEAEIDKEALPKTQRMRTFDIDPETDARIHREVPAGATGPAAGLEHVNLKHAPPVGTVADPATGAWVDISTWKGYVKSLKLRKVADDAHRTLPEPDRALLAKTISELEASPTMLPWGTAQRTAEGLRKFIPENADIDPTLRGELTKRMGDVLDRSMIEALETTGGPQLAAKWQSVQKLRAEAKAAYVGGVLEAVQKGKHNVIPQVLTNPAFDNSDVALMRKHLGSAETRAAVAENIKQAIEGSTKNVIEGRVIDPQQFARELRSQWPEGRLTAATGDATLEAAVYDFIREVEVTPRPRGIDVGQLNPGNQAQGLAGAVKGNISPSLVSAALGFTGLSKFLTSPNGWHNLRTAVRNAAVEGAAIGAGVGQAARVTNDERREQERDRAKSKVRHQ